MSTTSGDGERDWARLRSLTADSGFTENGEERNVRVKGLMLRWKNAALRARKLISDPWMDFNINLLPVIRAKRHRYSAIRKTWTVDIVEVKLLGDPFARGAMRECFRMKKLSSMSRNQDWTHANNYVAKRYIQEVDREVLFSDVRLQMDAKLWAEEFNRHSPPKKIDIVQMCVMEMLDMPGQPLYHLEHFIEGDYVKYNSNSGFVSDLARKTPQAFSHFTFERSGHQMIVVDIQGVGDLYTDPQIHTVAGTDYGDGNLGTKGMALFFHSHACNDICHSLCLTEFDLSDKEKKELADGTAVTRGEAATRFVRPASVCEPLVAQSEEEEGDAMACLRRRTMSVMSNSSGGTGGDSSSCGEKEKKKHDEDCVCEECLAECVTGVVLQDEEDEEDEEGDYGDDEEEEERGPVSRKVAFHTLSVERKDRERNDSLGSSYGGSSSRLTRDTEREEYWQGVRKQSMPAGVLSAIQMELLADEACRAHVSHQASVLGQIHLDLARYHELGRFLPEEDNSEKRVALGETDSSGEKSDEGLVNYDRESALYHLDVARRCGVLEAIVTVAQMAYGLPHELLKDVGEDEGWQELDEDGNAKVNDKEAFAFELMETAAEMGERTAMLFVAETYETGRRMGKEGRTSYPLAIQWYQKAMGFDEEEEGGTKEGSYRPRYEILAKMGEMYQEGGYDLDQDYERAYELYTEAAEVAMEAMKGKLANKYYEMAEMCAI
ncbi:efk-1 [Pristionchus pacificus]|nr:efk-1 [Pristionchus pacificus]